MFDNDCRLGEILVMESVIKLGRGCRVKRMSKTQSGKQVVMYCTDQKIEEIGCAELVGF